jgi:catechol 2,3-dioxygenase-like lactoylglutathione lyase family enzyme
MKCTHVALQVRDVEQSIAFYQRYCNMRIVHDRTDEFRVVWLGWGEDPPRFVIVLLAQDYGVNRQPPFQHLGMALPRREEVDEIARRAAADGYPVAWPPRDGGPVVGYFCGLIDPDGNTIEFSHGQRLG